MIDVTQPPFNAIGDGAADDTAAINAAIASCNALDRRDVFFPAGRYLVSAPLLPLVGSNWDFGGDGLASTTIVTTVDAPVVSLDVSAADSFFGGIHDLTFERVAGGDYFNSVGINIMADLASVTGAQYWQFQNLRFNNLYRGIRVGDTGKVAWGGFTDISRHGFLRFQNIISAYAADPMLETISFDGGCGPHIVIEGGHIRGTSAAIKIGNGLDNVAVGDIIISDVHIVIAGVGIDLIGPGNAAAGSYNQNVTISGCQFDNCSLATVRMARMKNFRILPNNSTSIVGMSLTDCSDFIVEDRNCMSGLKYNETLIARRNVNDQGVIISGGDSIGNGAQLELYGGAHPVVANHAYLDTSRLQVRSQNASTVLLEVSAAALKALIGGSLKTIAEGAVDSGGTGYRTLRVPN